MKKNPTFNYSDNEINLKTIPLSTGAGGGVKGAAFWEVDGDTG